MTCFFIDNFESTVNCRFLAESEKRILQESNQFGGKVVKHLTEYLVSST